MLDYVLIEIPKDVLKTNLFLRVLCVLPVRFFSVSFLLFAEWVRRLP